MKRTPYLFKTPQLLGFCLIGFPLISLSSNQVTVYNITNTCQTEQFNDQSSPPVGTHPIDSVAKVSQPVQMWTQDENGYFVPGDTVNVGDSINGYYLNGNDVQILYGNKPHYIGIEVGSDKTEIYLTTRKWYPGGEASYEIYAYGELPSNCPTP